MIHHLRLFAVELLLDLRYVIVRGCLVLFAAWSILLINSARLENAHESNTADDCISDLFILMQPCKLFWSRLLVLGNSVSYTFRPTYDAQQNDFVTSCSDY